MASSIVVRAAAPTRVAGDVAALTAASRAAQDHYEGLCREAGVAPVEAFVEYLAKAEAVPEDAPLPHCLLTSSAAGRKLRDEDFLHIAELLVQRPDIATVLDVSGNELTATGAAQLLDAVSASDVQALSLGQNPLGDAGALAVVERLARGCEAGECRLSVLSMPAIGLTARGIEAVLAVLPRVTTLARLDARNNAIGPEGGEHVARALTVPSTLTSISLRNCGLGDEGVEAIAGAFQRTAAADDDGPGAHIVRLKSLDVANNQASARAMSALLNALAGTANEGRLSLQALDVSGNVLHEEGSRALARMLRCGAQIQGLSADHTAAGPTGFAAIAEALPETDRLRYLSLRGCDIDGTAMRALAAALRANTSLTRVVADGPLTRDAVARVDELANALGANTTLTALSLDRAAAERADALQEIQRTLSTNHKVASASADRPAPASAADSRAQAPPAAAQGAEGARGAPDAVFAAAQARARETLTRPDLGDAGARGSLGRLQHFVGRLQDRAAALERAHAEARAESQRAREEAAEAVGVTLPARRKGRGEEEEEEEEEESAIVQAALGSEDETERAVAKAMAAWTTRAERRWGMRFAEMQSRLADNLAEVTGTVARSLQGAVEEVEFVAEAAATAVAESEAVAEGRQQELARRVAALERQMMAQGGGGGGGEGGTLASRVGALEARVREAAEQATRDREASAQQLEVVHVLADKVQGAASQLQTYASEGGGSSKGGDSVDEAMRRRVLPRLRELASAVQEQVVGEVMERQQTSLVEMEVNRHIDFNRLDKRLMALDERLGSLETAVASEQENGLKALESLLHSVQGGQDAQAAVERHMQAQQQQGRR